MTRIGKFVQEENASLIVQDSSGGRARGTRSDY